MFNPRKKSPTLSWLDCLSGARGTVEQLPATIPAGPPTASARVIAVGNELSLEPATEGVVLVNGVPLRHKLPLTDSATLQSDASLLVLGPGEQTDFALVTQTSGCFSIR
ncbi:MAG: hypothetical protein ACKO8X_05985 [Verrucomicrobiota bacterium]